MCNISEFLRHMAYVGFIFSLTFTCYCVGLCGMEAATLLSDVQWCHLKLSRLHHNVDVVLNLCIISFIRLATLCFLNKFLIICICMATVCMTNSINIFIYKVNSATFKENGNLNHSAAKA